MTVCVIIVHATILMGRIFYVGSYGVVKIGFVSKKQGLKSYLI